MFIFILANLPLPLILYLNWRVTKEFLTVRRLSKHTKTPIAQPQRLTVGWWMGNFAAIFVWLPAITEHRFFVQDPRWLICYAVSAGLTIGGLLLMNNALGKELQDLYSPG